MLEWDSDSTMLLLHKRLHLLVNEANSHNRLLNCKNLVLEKIIEILVLENLVQKFKYWTKKSNMKFYV